LAIKHFATETQSTGIWYTCGRFCVPVQSGIYQSASERRNGKSAAKSKMDSFKLIENFGERLGMTLGHNPDGVYLFEIDGLAFAIHDLDECSRIVLSGDLGHPPPECREKLCVALLEAQHMLKNSAGATFSLNPETGNFSLCKALVPAVLDADGFFAETESFVNTLHAWADIIRDFRPELAAAAGDPPGLHDSSCITP
jgi:hypothetical protein